MILYDVCVCYVLCGIRCSSSLVDVTYHMAVLLSCDIIIHREVCVAYNLWSTTDCIVYEVHSLVHPTHSTSRLIYYNI